ncbi:hypothetical protein BRC81_02285 [Halobacteriales archaeon QS_1_68_20]|nr:MAG: hypothetical protein BRC81_02285 [Halobacteriales archaeon QS_1_68_20]
MRRRRFVASGATVGALTLAGCLGSSPTPPPRRSEVFEAVGADGTSLQMNLAGQPVVESRADVDAAEGSGSFGSVVAALAALNPVGTAAAAKGGGGGRGATGRGSGEHGSAPKNHNGHAKYHGGDYDDWREEHEDEVETYQAEVALLAIGFIGTDPQMEDSPPEPGPIDWDETWQDPQPDQDITYEPPRTGWYRTGAKLEAKGANHSFGWECLDFRVNDANETVEVDNVWKVSPRL